MPRTLFLQSCTYLWHHLVWLSFFANKKMNELHCQADSSKNILCNDETPNPTNQLYSTETVVASTFVPWCVKILCVCGTDDT
jgi:hypothetical protein